MGENEGWGSSFGAPVAGALMVRYLGGREKHLTEILNPSREDWD
ncbi:MAG: hypothetical protein R3A12_10650 [Ignavibacteria bacterium]